MQNQDLYPLFDEINHISLNYHELLAYFLEYIEKHSPSAPAALSSAPPDQTPKDTTDIINITNIKETEDAEDAQNSVESTQHSDSHPETDLAPKKANAFTKLNPLAPSIFSLPERLQKIASFDHLLGDPQFLECAVLSTRQSVVLAMLSISMESALSTPQFQQLCLNCNCQSSKLHYLKEALGGLLLANTSDDSSPSLDAEDMAIIERHFLKFFLDFERETYSKILSKNKDLQKTSLLSHALIEERKNVFFQLIENKL